MCANPLILLFRHGFNKKISRGAQQFKIVTLGERNRDNDSSFLELKTVFDKQLKNLPFFISGMRSWSAAFAASLEVQLQNAIQFQEIMELEDDSAVNSGVSIHVESLKEFRDTRLPEIRRELQETIMSIENLEKLYKNALRAIKKREAKLLDHNRLRELEARGETDIDKSLIESSESYSALHQHLLEELPKFLSLAQDYMDSCISDFCRLCTDSAAGLSRVYEEQPDHGSFPDPLLSLSELTIACRKGKGSAPNSPERRTFGQGASTPETSPSHSCDAYFTLRVLYQFQAELEDEVSLENVGEELQVLSTSEREGWSYVKFLDGRRGYCPENYIG